MSGSIVFKINKEIQNIRSRYEKKYGAVIFDVKVKKANDIIVLEGAVLSEKQKKEVFLAAKEIIKDGIFESKINVLSDLKNNLEIGWGVIKSGASDIRTKLSNKKNLKGLASQALKGEAVRILAKVGAKRLVQTQDLAIGWINSSQIMNTKNKKVKKEWLKARRVKLGEVIKKRLNNNIHNKFILFLEKYLNAPYLLGGMTEKGIDCSGLAEKFYSDIFGIILPRHSTDQALCGGKIDLADACFGDLVFMRNKATKQAHIGVVVEKFEKSRVKHKNLENILILNARREKAATQIEDLPEILKKYNLIYLKRIIEGV